MEVHATFCKIPVVIEVHSGTKPDKTSEQT